MTEIKMTEEELLEKMDEKLCYASSINIDVVEKLFRSVDNYVKSNYLFDSEDKYYLKYKNRMLLVGYYTGPETLYYLRLTFDKHVGYYVDYEDMKCNRLNPEQQEVKDKIDGINDTITMLESRGISRKLIKNSIRI